MSIPSRRSTRGPRTPVRVALIALIALSTTTVAASAQDLFLDPSCTATVGNQTVAVRDDGSFLVPNIALLTQVRTRELAEQLHRARVTCLRGGEMTTGQSDFISITSATTTFVGPIRPIALDPIPFRLATTAPLEVLAQGASMQLTVTGTYLDGSVRNLSARETGTTYLTSNPDILNIDENGRVTAVNPEARLRAVGVTAINAGNLAWVPLKVAGPPDDLDSDGLPNAYEELHGLDPLLAFDAFLDSDLDGLTNFEEFGRGTLPNDPDTDRDGVLDGVDGDPLRPDELPPVVTIAVPAPDHPVHAGESFFLRADVTDDGVITEVELAVNDLIVATLTEPPYETLFTVPFATPSLLVQARAIDGRQNQGEDARAIVVIDDPGTTVHGRVLDREGLPLAGADVRLLSRGLRGELFDFDTPLEGLPPLAGLTPDAVIPISAVNLLNPDALLSPDTFGQGFSPDFAARLSGHFRVTAAGSHTFTLLADDGARLVIDGETVVETAPGEGRVEASGSIALDRGTVPIEISFFQAVGDAELQLRVELPGAVEAQPVAPHLLQDTTSLGTVTGADGTFTLPEVPTITGALQAEITATIDGAPHRRLTLPTPPRPDGTIDLGDIVPLATAQVLVFGSNSGKARLGDVLEQAGHAVTVANFLPADDLSTFDVIWFLGTLELSAADQARLIAFVRQGGGLHLTGERSGFSRLDQSVQNVLAGTLLDQGVELQPVDADPPIPLPFRFAPTAQFDITALPNALTDFRVVGAGRLSGLAEDDPHILVTSAFGVVVGGVWACSDLDGGRGKVTVLADSNWVLAEPLDGLTLAVGNLQNLLTNVCPASN